MKNYPEKGELISRIRAQINDQVVVSFMQLLEVQIEEWKEALVDADKTTYPKLQGAVKHTRLLLADLTRKTKRTEFKSGAYTGA